MIKSVILASLLLGAAAATATPAIWESDFGTAIVSGDDNTTTANFGFAFPLFGASYSTFEASTNGFISVGGSNGQGCCTGFAGGSGSGGLLDGAARIAPQWLDLVDTVYLNTAVAGRAVITWQGFEYYDPTVTITTQAQLFDTGRIVFGYDGPSIPTQHPSLTGVSIGGNATNPGASSLLGARFSTGNVQTVYQEFAPGTFNLNGTNVVMTPNSAGGLNVGAVPEPASWALMVAGFGLVGGAVRPPCRRRRGLNDRRRQGRTRGSAPLRAFDGR